MAGAEHLTPDVLAALWNELADAFTVGRHRFPGRTTAGPFRQGRDGAHLPARHRALRPRS
jgi:hypothetical protein